MRFSREITAAIGAPVVIWLIGWSHEYVFDAVIALVAILALIEFVNLGKHKGYDIPLVLCVVIVVIIMAAFILEHLSVELGVFAALLLIPASYVFSRKPLEDSLPSSAVAVLATTYVGMLTGSLIRLRNDFPEGWKLVFFLLLVVWLGDSGAYYFGKSFGKHKLSPRISPKKTIEGLIGGIVTSIVAAIVIHLTFFKNFPLHHAIIAGVLLSFAGVVGDLAESMWKRSADVKDSGTLLPGHGGFLDRFDGMLFALPVAYYLCRLLEIG
ncbi:MAG TPA: phosphatidate cytidylyltransferase [Thermoanaerobaculia bacterium]|nr:phosphatidate cytidylyltransferase [Thermoanaerobaculia bacterium]